MQSLKDLRRRIASVKSTKQITSAMKMVAASKLRRAQDAAEAARPYAERMERMLANLTANSIYQTGTPPLLMGNGRDSTYLLIAVTANRGLCGAFNAAVVREIKRLIVALTARNKSIRILCVGCKGRDQLRRDYNELIVDTIEDIGSERGLTFKQADAIGQRVIALFETGVFDICTAIFNSFQSAISQVVTQRQLIPFLLPEQSYAEQQAVISPGALALYEYEPSEEEIMLSIAPHNVTIQIFRILLESAASEHGARMVAMDNAARNASDMIKNLTLTYNRTRQAYITRELIEIISGAEAL